ncbi:MAG: hypothetical protein GTN90_05975 [Xanthomonadales bacterium]|nr:hypothetical protein [Xanthomonadales bacterium]
MATLLIEINGTPNFFWSRWSVDLTCPYARQSIAHGVHYGWHRGDCSHLTDAM